MVTFLIEAHRPPTTRVLKEGSCGFNSTLSLFAIKVFVRSEEEFLRKTFPATRMLQSSSGSFPRGIVNCGFDVV
jgi:hypothetical protein